LLLLLSAQCCPVSSARATASPARFRSGQDSQRAADGQVALNDQMKVEARESGAAHRAVSGGPATGWLSALRGLPRRGPARRERRGIRAPTTLRASLRDGWCVSDPRWVAAASLTAAEGAPVSRLAGAGAREHERHRGGRPFAVSSWPAPGGSLPMMLWHSTRGCWTREDSSSVFAGRDLGRGERRAVPRTRPTGSDRFYRVP